MIIQLVIRNRGQAGKRVRVKEPIFVIGRDDGCQLRSRSHSVSAKHCVIVQRSGKVYVKDLASRNGTYVNDQPIGEGLSTRLFHRDKLQVGKMSFRVHILDPQTKEPVARGAGDADLASASGTITFLNKSRFHSVRLGTIQRKLAAKIAAQNASK